MMRENMSSGNLLADKRADYARMLGEAGDFQAAADLMQQALDITPEWHAGRFQLGGFLEKSGKVDAAVQAYERVLKASVTDKFGARLKLSYLRGDRIDGPQVDYVEALFDEYAVKFDNALVERLQYRVPQLLAELIVSNCDGRRFAHCVDLGCGTGLMAQAIGGMVLRLTGIDISSEMLSVADAKGNYSALIKADVVDGISVAAEADLVTAADVFMYLGSLEPVMKSVTQHIVPGGVFAFSVELERSGADFQLRQSLRHAHSAHYVKRLLVTHGFSLLAEAIEVIRTDGGSPIEGLLVVAVKSSGQSHDVQ